MFGCDVTLVHYISFERITITYYHASHFDQSAPRYYVLHFRVDLFTYRFHLYRSHIYTLGALYHILSTYMFRIQQSKCNLNPLTYLKRKTKFNLDLKLFIE